jgi:hypothetical protein
MHDAHSSLFYVLATQKRIPEGESAFVLLFIQAWYDQS